MELLPKHIAPYIPYGIPVFTNKGSFPFSNDWQETGSLFASCPGYTGGNADIYMVLKHPESVKVGLRPMSEAFKNITIGDNTFCPADALDDLAGHGAPRHWLLTFPPMSIPYWAIEMMISWGFDVFGLIDEGLAIDITKSHE